eukprot:UN06167
MNKDALACHTETQTNGVRYGWTKMNLYQTRLSGKNTLDTTGSFLLKLMPQLEENGWKCEKRTDMCPSGSVSVSGAMVSYGARRHGENWTASCPTGFDGTANLVCYNHGPSAVKVHLLSGSCVAICSQTTVESNGAEIIVGAMSQNAFASLTCPSMYDGVSYAGTVTVQCTHPNTKIVIGSCVRQTCVQTTVTEPGAGQLITFPETNHGASASVSCPSGYTGNVTASCSNGSFMNQQGGCAMAAEEEEKFGGICKDQYGKSPPNYSKNNMSKIDCEAACTAESLCVGYSTSTNNRCSLWVEQSIGTCPEKTGWEKHAGNGWIMGQSVITEVHANDIPKAEKDAGLMCYPDRSKEPVEFVVSYNYMGTGMCTISNSNLTSPSNYSKNHNSLDNDYCQKECDLTNRCIGLSILTDGAMLKRCALWIDQAKGQMPAKSGWEGPYSGEAGWNYGVSTIAGSDKAGSGWNCYKRISTVVIAEAVVEYKFTPKGMGVCTNAQDKTAANISKNGVEMADCEEFCKQYANCEGIGYMLNHPVDNTPIKRCALYIDEAQHGIDNKNMPTKNGAHVSGFQSNPGTAPVGNWKATHSSNGPESPWQCYSRDAMVN